MGPGVQSLTIGRMNWVTSERSANPTPTCRIGGCSLLAEGEEMCGEHLAVVVARRAVALASRAKWGRRQPVDGLPG